MIAKFTALAPIAAEILFAYFFLVFASVKINELVMKKAGKKIEAHSGNSF